MINLQQEFNKFLPINLDALLRRNANLPDNVKNSIVLYNNALESLKTGSEDIAVIELKKAVAMNPDFYEAMNLLGLCYAYINDNEKATEMFEKVIKAENNSIKALEYLNALNQNDSGTSFGKEKKKRLPKEGKLKALTASLKEPKDLSSGTKEKKAGDKSERARIIAAFVAGVIVTAIVAVPVFFALSGNRPAENTDGTDEIEAIAAERDQYREKYENLNKDLTMLQEQLSLANKEIDYYKDVARLYSVDGLANAKKYEEAADLLIELKQVQFRDAEKAKYDELYASVIPNAVSAIYSEGNRLFNTQKYQEAVDKLNKILAYVDDWQHMDATLYVLGKSYAALNDKENAMAAYQKVIDRYPNSQYAGWSAGRIRELEQLT